MRLQQGTSPWSDLNHNNEVKKSGRMPYVCVRENAVKWWVLAPIKCVKPNPIYKLIDLPSKYLRFSSNNHFTARWVSVHGLNHHEMRLLAEKVSDQPETLDTGDKLVEFSLPSWQVRVNESTLKKNLEAWFGPRASLEKN